MTNHMVVQITHKPPRLPHEPDRMPDVYSKVSRVGFFPGVLTLAVDDGTRIIHLEPMDVVTIA